MRAFRLVVDGTINPKIQDNAFSPLLYRAYQAVNRQMHVMPSCMSFCVLKLSLKLNEERAGNTTGNTLGNTTYVA